MAKNTPIPPEEHQLRKQLSNRTWRLNNLYWTQDQNGQKVKFRMRWAQKLFFETMWWLNEVLKVRQIGISTFTGILQLDHALFTSDQTCGLIDRTDNDAKKKLRKILFAYEHLDDPDDPGTAALGALIKASVKLVTSNKSEMEFSNGSKIWAATSLRGSACNFLHVSEMGYIAYQDPSRAEEIASGCFNTVHAGNIIIVEATHEGGRYGLNYELIRQAQRFDPANATPLDWKFHFFPWWGERTYTMAVPESGFTIPQELDRYFTNIEKECRVKLSDEQKFWYIKKSQSPKVDMARQYPGTPEEALQALTEGSIYGPQIAKLRAAGRVKNFEPTDRGQLLVSWDLGQSDFHTAWLLEIIGLDINVLDYWTGRRNTVGQQVAHCMGWEKTYGKEITKHFLPHDAHQINSSASTVYKDFIAAGVPANRITVVPRTPDIWVGIKHLRGLLPNFRFHATNCERESETDDGILMPSGLGALEGYHQKVESANGRLMEMPVHDQASHGADGLRTFAEAHQRGMINKTISGEAGAVSVYGRLKRFRLGGKKKIGLREPSTTRKRRR